MSEPSGLRSMSDRQQQNRYKKMRKEYRTINYKGVELEVSNTGDIYFKGEEVPQYKNKKTGYMGCGVWDSIGKRRVSVSVHRAVCAAFHPVEGWEHLQCDHIDNDKTNNNQNNLRFVTRQFNNSRPHAKQMREVNRRMTRHDSEYVRAEHTGSGEVRFYKNGKQASIGIGCSSPFVYMALTGKTDTCYGWKLNYVPADAPEVKEFKEWLKEQKKLKEEAQIEKQRKLKEQIVRHRIQLKKARAELKRIVRSDMATFGRRERLVSDMNKEITKDWHAVLQLTLDGELVKEWSSVYEATKATGLTTIRDAVLSGNDGAEKGGYIWKYKIQRESELVNWTQEMVNELVK